MLLKFSRTTSKESRSFTIRKILTQLGLVSLAQARIATLSGGERKKLNLATELLSEPCFLFCDEPTTGLDSFNALLVMKTLRNLCQITRDHSDNFEMEIVNSDKELWHQDQPRSFPKGVVCSIHQPTSDIFHCFAQFIILREGRVVFQGNSVQAEEKFREAGYICPENYNPMEFYVKTISMTSDLNFVTFQEQSAEEDQIQAEAGSWRIATNNDSSALWILQVFYLIKRAWIITRRSMLSIATRSALYFFLAVIYSLAYQGVNSKTQRSIQDIAGLLFSCCCEMIFTNQYMVIMTFSPELPLIRRETGERLFCVSALYVASVLQQVPRAFVESFIFMAIINCIPGFSVDFWSYIRISVMFSFTALSAMAYGFMIAGVFVKEKLVQEVSVPLDTLMMVLGGLYLNVNALSYMKFLSLFFLSNEAISVFFWREVESIECSTEKNCLRNGTEVLTYYSFGTELSTIWRDYLYLILWFFICHILGYLGLRRYVQKEGFY